MIHVLMLLVFASLANLHLPVLQLAAWTSMVVKYSDEAPMREALEMTFSGEYPCDMCVAIKNQQEEDSATLKEAMPSARTLLFLESPRSWVQTMICVGTTDVSPFVAGCFAPLPERHPPRSFA